MKTKSNSLYYIIEGEPYLSVAKAFVNEYQAAHKRVCDYLDGLGVSQWRYGFSGHIAGVVFEGNIPPDFCKPDNYGVTRPKKTSKYYNENFALLEIKTKKYLNESFAPLKSLKIKGWHQF